MAIKRLDQSDDDQLSVTINNGDYRALRDIKTKWGFVSEEAALRFGLAVLTLSENGTLLVKESDGNKILQPIEGVKE